MVRAVITLLVLALVGCGDDIRGNITIVADARWEPVLRELAELSNYSGLSVNTDPGDGYQIVVVEDPAIPTEGYQLTVEGDTIRVAAHDLLGVQYGVHGFLVDEIDFVTTWIDGRDALLVIPLIVGLGLVLAALSASFAIRRWLRT